MLGMIGSNYSGVYGIGINPSSMQGSKLYMDYNLLTFQSFFENNYAYWEKEDFMQFLSSRELPVYYTDENEERNFTIYRDDIPKNGFQSLKIMGPSGMLVYGKHAFGLTTAIRSINSFDGLPPDMAVFLYEAIDYEFQHNINYMHFDRIATTSISWAELGLSYAYNFHRYRWNSWTAGITIKPLMGLTAAFASIDNLDYTVHFDDSATVYNASFQYGYALPLEYESNTYNSSPLFKGFGFSTDIGITFAKTTKGHSNMYFSRLCEQSYEDYNYRIGFSILDLGFIRYGKNAQMFAYDGANTEWYKPYDTINPNSIEEINAKISQFFGDAMTEADSKSYFTVYLPTVASLQADIHLNKTWYINSTIIHPLNFSSRSIFRPSVVSVSPRYETARMEVSLPVSLYNYDFSKLRLGLMFRYGNVFLGVDKLNILISSANVTGIDFYAGIRLNLTNVFRMNYIKGYCDNKKLRNIETFDFRNF
jgi:hypothetical protein